LDKLASFLCKNKLLQHEFFHYQKKVLIASRKGVFPYEYIDCVEKLEELCLLLRKSFYSSLTDYTVSENAYAHAVNVCRCQWFFGHSVNTATYIWKQTYYCWSTSLKISATVASRVMGSTPHIITSYTLHVGRYVKAYGCKIWTAHRHWHDHIYRAIRGGLNQCSNRYARANNKYMSSYDPWKPSSYWCTMTSTIYTAGQCVKHCLTPIFNGSTTQNFYFTIIELDSTSYISNRLYSRGGRGVQHFHDVHTDLTFCTRDKPLSKRDDKLLATLCDK